MEIKLDLSKHEEIPKLIHMTWKNKEHPQWFKSINNVN